VAAPGARFGTAQIVPFGPEDSEHLRAIHRAKQPDLTWFPTQEALQQCLSAAGWHIAEQAELLIDEEIGAWLRWAPEAGERAPEVARLVQEAPEAYRALHRVRKGERELWDTFRWIIICSWKPRRGRSLVDPALLQLLQCQRCRYAPLQEAAEQLACPACGATAAVDAGVPRFGPLEVRSSAAPGTSGAAAE
jgi:hypothetical protein